MGSLGIACPTPWVGFPERLHGGLDLGKTFHSRADDTSDPGVVVDCRGMFEVEQGDGGGMLPGDGSGFPWWLILVLVAVLVAVYFLTD